MEARPSPLVAQVAVDAPTPPGRTYSYAVPPGLSVVPGQAVWAPLGPRPVQGVVFAVGPEPPEGLEELRPLLGLVDPLPLLGGHQLAMARWLSNYYLAPLFACAALMLPPGFRRRVRAVLSPAPGAEEALPSLPPGPARALRWVARNAPAEWEDLRRALGREGERGARWLLQRGLLLRRWHYQRPRVGPLYVPELHPLVPPAGLEEALRGLARAPRQAELLRYLAQVGTLPLTQARKEFGESAVAGLRARGLVEVVYRRRLRDPLAGRAGPREVPLALTPPQRGAVEAVRRALEDPSTRPRSFLLQGVTGSGKTEVYLQAIALCLGLGRRALYLVPELSLTPQVVERLTRRFPGQVGVLHSGLSPGQQFDQWWRIRQGDYGVVLGSRGAVFAPVEDLGLIVIDEEHEWTYKQQDPPPRYHARQVALEWSRLTGAVVLMGSATPDVATYHQALQGGHRLLTLGGRLAPGPGGRPVPRPLPRAVVVDMRAELREGGGGIFSRALRQALKETLASGEQALLFINRRGTAPLVECPRCGLVERCRRCDVTLAFHAQEGQMLCHQCGRRYGPPGPCPRCGNPRRWLLGFGTQRVVEEVRRLFPGTPVLRWDRDAVGRAQDHEALIARFLAGEAQVLVGTQMVAQGLHLPRVGLVGVLLADVGLHLPDYRAGERTFQLLCQVAGRAGRAGVRGRVIIQTFSPGHYAVVAGAGQDYTAFYQREIAYRRELGNPPFSRLVRLLYRHPNEQACREAVEALAEQLRRRREAVGMAEVEFIGPAPAFPARVRGRYRWHLLLRGPQPQRLLEGLALPQGWSVDVDPVELA